MKIRVLAGEITQTIKKQMLAFSSGHVEEFRVTQCLHCVRMLSVVQENVFGYYLWR